MLTIKNDKFISVLKDLVRFEINIDKYYESVKKDNRPKKDSGYLINKAVLDDLKQKLSFSHFRNLNENLFYKKKTEIFKNLEKITFKGAEQKIFNSYKEMKEDLMKNKKEYIIVNKKIWSWINNGKKTEYEGIKTYEINSKNFILFINDQEKAFFKHDSNIINYKNLLEEEIKDENKIIISGIEEVKENQKAKNVQKQLAKSKILPSSIKQGEKTSNPFKKGIKSMIAFYYFTKEINKQIKEPTKSKNNK